MEPRSLKYLAEACGGELLNGSPQRLATNICTDSRKAGPGDLFFALVGERFDAHKFLHEVARTGVIGVVAERKKIPANFITTVIAVENTREALGRLAARYRKDFDLPIVAVGGSNGKTTTKELLASVLRQRFKTLWSEASFNNDIGVPTTLLNLKSDHEIAVLEVGTNHPGELAPLLRLIRPNLGVITNIGREHLEFFGDLDGVVKEEGALAEELAKEGTLFVNGDCELMTPIIQRSRAKVISVGFNDGNDYSARDVQFDETGVTFLASARRADLSGRYRIKLLGRHQVLNALLAIAVAGELGMDCEEIRAGLSLCEPAKMRLQLSTTRGIQILDDSYNANADSMMTALETLKELPCAGRRVAVLGDMAELGQHSNSAHAEIGTHAAKIGLHLLLAVGSFASVTAGAARGAGMQEVKEFSSVELAGQWLREFVMAGDVILLKGSRSSGMERIGEILKK